MENKRHSIRQKVQTIVLLIAVIALVATSSAGILSMVNIKSQTEHSLLGQVGQDLNHIAISKAELADSKFGKYADYMKTFSLYINELYKSPGDYVKKEVLPPDVSKAGNFNIQRELASKEISVGEVMDELSLFGNLKQIWAPVLEENSDVIVTIYAGTESGFMVSYDNTPYLEEGESEAYFNYYDRYWYTLAKETGDVCYTDVYYDDYGRGLMITCAAPFYDAEDKFAGVVAMDMLISDLHRSVVNIDLGEGSYALLLDSSGNIITDSDESAQKTDFQNIDELDEMNEKLKEEILRGSTGVEMPADGDIYYAYAPIGSIDWRLCTAVPKALVMQPVDKMSTDIRNTIVVFVAFFVLVIFLVILISRKFSQSLTEPLIALGKDVMVISEGDLDYRAKIYNNDEIGDLARGFNDMASSLKQYIEEFAAVAAEKERIGAELNVATQIQADMLPRIFPAFPDRSEFDIYATMNPAKEVGGDFYDYYLVDDDHICLVMADVSGKGVPAALFMVIAKTLIKNRAQMGDNPSEILENVNNQLCEGNDADMFVTVWIGIIEISTGKGTAANAGHEHPVIKRKDGDYELVVYRHSPAVGTMEGIPFRQHDFELAPGDTLYVYTDGVAEATDAHNELFGTDRMIESLNRYKDEQPKELLIGIKKDIDEFVGDAPQFDDITMLAFTYLGKENNTNA